MKSTKPGGDLQASLGTAYRLEREIGRGSMARVFLAHDAKHDRLVALKLLNAELTASLGAERFRRETALVARLQHPHVLTVLDSGETRAGQLWFTMPYVEGESLRDRLIREPQLPVSEALRITREVADALEYAHAHGVVHRDVKPANILVSGEHALLMDFGIARPMQRSAGPPETTDSLTATGLVVGTPAYLSPEQANADPSLDGRTDIYSLATVLYEMLAGELPFMGRTAQALIAKRLSTLPPSVRVVRPSVPGSIDLALRKALAPAPADRYRSAAAFAHALALDERGRATPVGVGPDLSIAVLPFVDLSAGPDNEYFSDGVSEEILNALARLPGLRVAARTSSFAFKGKSVDLNEVGAKLRVALVLEGSVRRSGSRLRISAQLITVEDGFHLWSDRYDREDTDVFAVQDEIAGAIARVLKVKLFGDSLPSLVAVTRDLQAYELYLKGRYLWNQRGIGLAKSVPFFQRALERDPAFALAHAGLADACNLIAFYGLAPPRAISERARAAANRALALDDTLAEAHCAVGCNALFLDWNWDVADRAFDRAIALNPSYAPAYYYRPTVAGCRQQWDEAVDRARLAVERDPLGLQALAVLGWQLMGRHQLDAAAAALEQALELNADFLLANGLLGRVETARGNSKRALEVLEHAVTISNRNPAAVGSLAEALIDAGRERESRALLGELEQRSTTEYVASIYLSTIYAALGEDRTALSHFARAVDGREPYAVIAQHDPRWNRFQNTGQFTEIIQRIGPAR